MHDSSTRHESPAELLRRSRIRAGKVPSRSETHWARLVRVPALALVVFSLSETLPIPVAGFSALLAVPLILISGHLLLAGDHKPLPDFLLRRKLDPRLVRLVTGKAGRLLLRIEAVSRPRLRSLVNQQRVLAGVCLLLALIVALPIPFFNMPPAICLLIVSVGMLQRDGVLALAGAAGWSSCSARAFCWSTPSSGGLLPEALCWQRLPADSYTSILTVRTGPLWL